MFIFPKNESYLECDGEISMCNICVWLCACDMHVSVHFLTFGKVILSKG